MRFVIVGLWLFWMAVALWWIWDHRPATLPRRQQERAERLAHAQHHVDEYPETLAGKFGGLSLALEALRKELLRPR